MGMTDTQRERDDLNRKLKASYQPGTTSAAYGYHARVEAIRKRLDELDMKDAGQ